FRSRLRTATLAASTEITRNGPKEARGGTSSVVSPFHRISSCRLGESARLRQRKPHDAVAILIDEAKMLPRRYHLRRQRIVAKRLSAKMRRHAAHVRCLLVFDAEQAK